MSAPVSVSRRLLSIEEYHKLGEAGVLGEDDRVELIDGRDVGRIRQHQKEFQPQAKHQQPSQRQQAKDQHSQEPQLSG